MVKFADSSLPDLEEGEYPAVLNGVVWLGMQEQDERSAKKYGVKDPTSQLRLLFEIPTQTNRYDENVVTTKTVKNVTTSAKGNFIKLASAMLGKKLSSAELAVYLKGANPFKELLGKQLSISIEHFNSDDGLKAFVSDVKQPHPKDDPVKGARPVVYFDPTASDAAANWTKLSYYTKAQIMSAVDADEYPKELHKQWVKDQEEQATKEAEAAAKSDSHLA